MIPGGSGNPIETARMVRGLLRAANRYVQARGLPTREVPWDEYLALKKSAAAAEGGTPGTSPG